MPTPGAERPIQRVPSGLPGPGRDRLQALRPRVVRRRVPPRVALLVDDPEDARRRRVDRLAGRDVEGADEPRRVEEPERVRGAVDRRSTGPKLGERVPRRPNGSVTQRERRARAGRELLLDRALRIASSSTASPAGRRGRRGPASRRAEQPRRSAARARRACASLSTNVATAALENLTGSAIRLRGVADERRADGRVRRPPARRAAAGDDGDRLRRGRRSTIGRANVALDRACRAGCAVSPPTRAPSTETPGAIACSTSAAGAAAHASPAAASNAAIVLSSSSTARN